MKLPDEIPERLGNLALFLPEFDDSEGAWFKADAMAVIESLKGTIVAVSEVVILNMAPGGYMPSGLTISMDRFPNEADSDYAERSRHLALDFIRNSETGNNQSLFVLTFPLWKEVA